MGNNAGRVVAGLATFGLSEIHFQEEDRRRERRRRARELERQREEQRRREEELAAERRRQEQLERDRARRARDLEEQQRRVRQEQERRAREQREQKARAAEARRKAAEEERKRKEEQQLERLEALWRQKQELSTQLADVEKRLRRIKNDISTTARRQHEVESELAKERQQIEKFTHERNDRNVLRIILLGETGDGKSTVANRLFGDESEDADLGPFSVSASVHSCTQRIQKEVSRYVVEDGNCYALSIVDTPGSGDSGGRDRFHAASLVKYLRGCDGVHLFVLVRNFTNPRLNSLHQEMLTKMTQMFGRGFWARFCVLLTHVDTSRDRRKIAKVITELRGRIRDRFELTPSEAPLAIFGIGLDDYKTDLDSFVVHAAGGWYQCAHLTSPHDEIAAQARQLGQRVQELKHEVSSLTNKRNQINRDLLMARLSW